MGGEEDAGRRLTAAGWRFAKIGTGNLGQGYRGHGRNALGPAGSHAAARRMALGGSAHWRDVILRP